MYAFLSFTLCKPQSIIKRSCDSIDTSLCNILGKEWMFMCKKILRNVFMAATLAFFLAAGQVVSVAEAAPGDAEQKIIINLAGRSLALYQNGDRIKLYQIAPGKVSSPSPIGYYRIVEMEVNPTWIDPQNLQHVVTSGPDNPLGYRWIGFKNVYGIHGTNVPESIGHFASNGCIRMREPDVEELYDLVDIGTPIEIYYNRVVIEKGTDGTVAYNIYPDEYNMQNVDVQTVTKWLKGYGVADLVSDEAIAQKIAVSDGKPTDIAKIFPVILNGTPVNLKAVYKEGRTYFNVMNLAEIMNIRPDFSADKKTAVTKNGSANIVWLKGTAYITSSELPVLFKLRGMYTVDGKYTLTALR